MVLDNIVQRIIVVDVTSNPTGKMLFVGWLGNKQSHGQDTICWLGNKFEGLESRIWRVPLLLEVFLVACLVKGVLNAPPTQFSCILSCDTWQTEQLSSSSLVIKRLSYSRLDWSQQYFLCIILDLCSTTFGEYTKWMKSGW